MASRTGFYVQTCIFAIFLSKESLIFSGGLQKVDDELDSTIRRIIITLHKSEPHFFINLSLVRRLRNYVKTKYLPTDYFYTWF